MRLIPSGLVCLVLVNVARAVGATASADPGDEKWIADFQRFAAQKNIGVESSYSPRSGDGTDLSFSDLLRTLPAPQDWPRLRSALVEAASQVPPAQKVDRQRLQAGGWLLAYVTGDRAAIEADLTTAIAAAGAVEKTQTGIALGYLKERLSGQDETGSSPGKKIEEFEAELTMLEPADEAAVKNAVGGEENFARLKRVMAIGREMQLRFAQIQAEYEKTKDESVARAKAEALQKEFEGKGEAEWEALKPYQRNPVVQRYWFISSQETPDVSPDSNQGTTLYVPDLVHLVGRERATALLHRALKVSAKLEVIGEGEEETRLLVREVVLAEMDKVKAPSWGLVQDEHSVELFEAFHKKFPAIDSKDYGYRSACGYYLAGLIGRNRLAEAVKFAIQFQTDEGPENGINLPYEVMNKLEQAHPEELWQFLRGWLAAKPAVGEWDRFNRLSVQLDRSDELKALIKAMAEDGTFNGVNRLAVQRMQADTEMATGEIAAAVQRLQSVVQTPAASAGERSAQMDIVQRLLKLADLQADQAGFNHMLATAESLLAKNRLEKGDAEFLAAYELIGTLNGLGHFADSARIGRVELDRISELEKSAATKKASDGDPSSLPDYLLKNILGGQLWAEVELGHWGEARKLLQENSGWGVKDVAGMLHETMSGNTRSVGYYAARVVQEQGDPALARKILEAQLVATPDVDSVYSAYLGLAGQEALPLLEKLAASDRYQERPLIWKARLQMDAKRWDAAVVTLQQAITIDPSDGEQGRGDRMRVYAFMSETMAAKGDAEKATFFANVIKAIRLSETADRWYEIGAYTNAIELYRQALGFFQDAYCIQSRLAVRLADAGKMDEAVEHYRRAFELMPDSFGRVESHCFGCEHAFAGKKPQGVAEEVFARMLQARPDKPQLHYLFGYLREEQERLPEAAEHYRRAVQLDPLYLNAWKRLADLDQKLKVTPAQRDDLSLKLLELDPGQKHTSPDLEKVSDLPRLWRGLKESGEVIDALPVPGELWELKASAARLVQAKKEGNVSLSERGGRTRKSFATVLLGHPFVEGLQTYLATLNQPTEEAASDIKLID